MCATRGAEAAKKASEVPSTLSLLARRGDLQKTRAVTELMDPYATTKLYFLRRITSVTTAVRQD